MHQLYILYEHASGYAIFRTTEFEEVAVFLPQVRESILNVSKFRSNVYFVTYQPFTDIKEALINMQKMTSGELSMDLQLFLENNIPRTKKNKQAVVLGVEDPNLASVIMENLGIKCLSSGLVMEIIRGIRFHFYKLLKGFKDEDLGIKSQLSLAHNYSRERLNFDVTRQDCMIMESMSLIDEYEKDINTLGKRIREWYSCHFPELFRLIPHDTELYVQCVHTIGDRKNMPEDIEEKLNALLNDSSQVDTILKSAKQSMGTEIASVDLENLRMFSEEVIKLIKRRKSTIDYLRSKVDHTAPSLSCLLGGMIASRLISRAGGLEKLARLSSSAVQVLGAEKKFFRTFKDKDSQRKQKAPISGLLSNSAFMGKAGKKKKGRLARILANKSSLAARVDCFSKTSNDLFGKRLLEEVEQSIKYVKNVKIDVANDTEENEEAPEVMPIVKETSPMKTGEKSKSDSTLNGIDMFAKEKCQVAIAVNDVTKSSAQGKDDNDSLDSFFEDSEDDLNLLKHAQVKKKVPKKGIKSKKTKTVNQEMNDDSERENSNEVEMNYDSNRGSSTGMSKFAKAKESSKQSTNSVKNLRKKRKSGAVGFSEENDILDVEDKKKTEKSPFKKSKRATRSQKNKI